MKVDQVYGGHIQFTDKQNTKTRIKELARDKNNVVYYACVYRKRWDDIAEFKDYRYNVHEGSWIITMTAEESFHKRFLKLLNDEKAATRFFKHISPHGKETRHSEERRCRRWSNGVRPRGIEVRRDADAGDS